MSDERRSNWRDILEAMCRFCGAANRPPQVIYVECEPDGGRVCRVCGKAWRDDPPLDRPADP